MEAFKGKKINPDSPESKRIELIGKEQRLALTKQIERLEMTIELNNLYVKKKALELELEKLKLKGYFSRLFSGTAPLTAKQTAYGKLKNEIQELTEKIKLSRQSPMERRKLGNK